jgi:hypothetical protein
MIILKKKISVALFHLQINNLPFVIFLSKLALTSLNLKNFLKKNHSIKYVLLKNKNLIINSSNLVFFNFFFFADFLNFLNNFQYQIYSLKIKNLYFLIDIFLNFKIFEFCSIIKFFFKFKQIYMFILKYFFAIKQKFK